MDQAINFKLDGNDLILVYKPRDGIGWIGERFENDGYITIRKTFYLSRHNLTNDSGEILRLAFDNHERYDEYDSLEFKIAEKSEGYFYVDKQILDIKFDVLLNEVLFVDTNDFAKPNKEAVPNINSIVNFFCAIENISVFRKIDELSDENIVVGGEKPNAISVEDYNFLITSFPTKTEQKHYVNSRISNILKEYMGSMTDGEQKLKKYFDINKKRLNKIKSNGTTVTDSEPIVQIPIELYQHELEKFSNIQQIISEHLENAEETYSEDHWQKLIAEILPIIFPQYIAILNKVAINETYTKPTKTKREIDIVLVNAQGYIDILEIKKPFSHSLITTKPSYRDNHTPLRELSGTIMQAEKYVYYLNSLNIKDEENLTKKHHCQLPDGLSLKVRNPKVLIISGRSNHFTKRQKNDFEFIKRKYSNVADIVTYDDLLNRIENIVNTIKNKTSPESA